MFNRAILASVAACLLVLLAGCGSAHHTAYLTNPVSSSIAAYRVDNQSGKFTQIPGSPYTAGLSPSSILVHPNGKFAYAANGGGSNLSLFKISSFFALTEVMPRTPAGLNPSSIAIDPAGHFMVVCNSGDNNVRVFSIDATTGALTQVGNPVNVGYNPVFVIVSPSGKFVYVANAAGGTLSAFTLDSSGGLAQIPGSPYVLSTNSQSAGPNWIAIDPSEKYLFVANQLSSNVGGFTINSTSGGLTPIIGEPFTAGSNPSSLTFDKTGNYLYVANLRSSNVTAFGLTLGGIPRQVSGSPFSAGTSPNLITLDPSGQFVYVSSHDTKQIISFVVNPSTGQLAQKSTSPLADSPNALLILK